MNAGEKASTKGYIKIKKLEDEYLLVSFERSLNGSYWDPESLRKEFINNGFVAPNTSKILSLFRTIQESQKDVVKIRFKKDSISKNELALHKFIEWEVMISPENIDYIGVKILERVGLPHSLFNIDGNVSDISSINTDSIKFGFINKNEKILKFLDFRNFDFFYCNNVKFKKPYLISKEEGILVKGVNWITIIPYTIKDNVIIFRSVDKFSCILKYKYYYIEEDIMPYHKLIEQAQELGFTPQNIISEEEYSSLSLKKMQESDKNVSVNVSVPQDGFSKLELLQEVQGLSLSIRKGEGDGKSLSLEDMLYPLQDLHLYDYSAIKNDVVEFYSSSKKLFSKLVKEGDIQNAIDYATIYIGPEEAFSQGYIELIKLYIKDRKINVPHEDLDFIKNGKLVFKGDRLFRRVSKSYSGDTAIFSKTPFDELKVESGENILFQTKDDYDIYNSKIDGVFFYVELEGVLKLFVFEKVNSKLSIDTKEKNMFAYISYSPYKGLGKSYSVTQAQQLITKYIKNGIMKPSLSLLKENLIKNRPVFNQLLALGTDKDEKDNMGLIFQEQSISSAFKSFQNRFNIKLVNENSLIAFKKMETKKVNIFGEEVELSFEEEELFENARIKLGESISLKENGNIREYIASKRGVLIFDKDECFLEVDPYIVLSERNIKQPKMNFNKSVFLAVEKPLKDIVNSIVTNGSVYSVSNVDFQIISKGSVCIKGGISGSKLTRVGGDLKADFIESSSIITKGKIEIEKSISNATLIARRMECKTLSSSIIFVNSVFIANNISSRKGSTKICIGRDYILDEESRKLSANIEVMQEKIQVLENEIASEKLKNSLIEEDLKIRISKYKAEINNMSNAIFAMKENFENVFYEDAKIVVYGILESGTYIEFRDKGFEVKENLENVIISFKKGDISIERNFG